DWGFRADYIFGTDAFFTQAFGDIGYDNNWDASLQYGSALPQLYVVGAYNDLTVKAGHFFTPIGNEVVGATGNFFYSHAYTMLYGEPFTHTGVQADYKVNDQLTVTAGWVQGWDSGYNNVNNANCFLGGFTWTSEDANTSLLYYLTAGDWGNGTFVQSRNVTLTNGNIYMQSIVGKHKFCSGWQYIIQSDLGVNTNIPGDSTCWYGVNQYLIKELNCCWAVGARLEWFKDQDGVRVLDANGGTNAGSYYEATAGLNWKPHTNVNIRPELRYDWYTGQGTPYSDVSSKNQLTFGLDAYFTF
ncbi:MAG: porin, partial [Planctomycetia bacterium]|nr:porin [Planctomycetia bacterium]